MPATFILRGRLLGEDLGFPLQNRANIALVCPECGDLWARIQYEPKREWVGFRGVCDHCAPGFLDRGSFFQYEQFHLGLEGLTPSLKRVPGLLAWELTLLERRMTSGN